MLAVLQVAKSFLLEVAIDEEALDFFELSEETFKFLVIVVFDVLHLFAHAA